MRIRLGHMGCLSVVMFCAAGAAEAGDGVLLKPRFSKGQLQYIVGLSESKQTIKSQFGAMEMTLIKKSGHFQKVESTSMDGMEFSTFMERMSLTLDSPMMGKLSYDSDIPSMEEAPNLKQMLEPMIGEKMILRVDRDLKVTDVQGIDEILAKVEKKNAANPFAAGLRASFNKELISRQWRSIQIDPLPNKEVQMGDTWKYYPEEDVAQLGLSVKFDCTCKLDRVGRKDGRNVAFVSFAGKPTEYQQRMQVGGPLPKLEIKSGTLKGTFTFNIDDGRLLERDYNSECALGSPPAEEAKVDEAAAANGGMQVSLKSKNHVAFRTSDDRAKEKTANAKKAAELKAKEEKEAEEDESGDDAADEE